MTSGPVDTEVKLGKCPRCEKYVFTAMSSGLKVAADPVPATRDQYVATLAGGRRLFALTTVAGRPHKLLGVSKGAPPPPFDSEGAQGGAGRPCLVEHSCGAHGMDAARVEEVPMGPRSAPATPGSPRGGILPSHAPGATATDPGPVGRASHHLSEPTPRCGTCGRYIGGQELFWGIQHGVKWMYAEHEECP